MRILPIVTALIVAVALYALVFERERLLAFAGVGQEAGAPPSEVAQTAPETAEAPPPDAMAKAAPDAADRVVSVVAIQSEAAVVDNGVMLRGETHAARQVDARAELSGLIASEPLPKGTLVQAGDLLCEIAPGNRPAQLSEAEALLADAEIGFTAADRLATGGFGSETQKLSAKATLQGAEAAVDRAETEIDRLTIHAPFRGVLESDTAELGSLMQPGEICATVLQLDPIRLVGFLPETQVDLVRIGAPAGARLATGREVQGQVTFLSRSADPETRTFRVEVEVANPDLELRDGQTADIGISAQGVSAHLVPASALTLDDSGTMGLRVVDDDSRAAFVPVRILRDTPQGIYLTGLPDTATIIVVGQEYVGDGVKVKATLREDAT